MTGIGSGQDHSPERLVYVSLAEATTPRDGEVLHDHWWVSDPDKGLLFARVAGKRLAPQCNRDRRVADVVAKRLYPDAEVIQVDAVYLGHSRDGES